MATATKLKTTKNDQLVDLRDQLSEVEGYTKRQVRNISRNSAGGLDGEIRFQGMTFDVRKAKRARIWVLA